MRSTIHVPVYDLHHHQSDCLPEKQHRSMQEMRLHSTSGFVQSPKESSAITANCSIIALSPHLRFTCHSRTARRAKEDIRLKRDVCYNQRKIGAKSIKEVSQLESVTVLRSWSMARGKKFKRRRLWARPCSFQAKLCLRSREKFLHFHHACK